MNSIELIKTSHEKISSFSSFEIANVIILLIVKYLVIGNTKSVSFGRIALIYDRSIDFQESFSLKNYVRPWLINNKIKKCILILVETGYLEFVKSKGGAKYKMTNKGERFINSIEGMQLFTELTSVVMTECSAVSETLITSYRLLVK